MLGYLAYKDYSPMQWEKSHDEIFVSFQMHRPGHTEGIMVGTFACAITGHPLRITKPRAGKKYLPDIVRKPNQQPNEITLDQRGPQEFNLRELQSASFLPAWFLRLPQVVERTIYKLQEEKSQLEQQVQELNGKAQQLQQQLKHVQDKLTLQQTSRSGVRLDTTFPTPREICDQYRDLTDRQHLVPELLVAGQVSASAFCAFLKNRYQEASTIVESFLSGQIGVKAMMKNTGSDLFGALPMDQFAGEDSLRIILQDTFPEWLNSAMGNDDTSSPNTVQPQHTEPQSNCDSKQEATTEHAPSNPDQVREEGSARREQDDVEGPGEIHPELEVLGHQFVTTFAACRLTNPSIELDFPDNVHALDDRQLDFMDTKPPATVARNRIKIELAVPGLKTAGQQLVPPRFLWRHCPESHEESMVSQSEHDASTGDLSSENASRLSETSAPSSHGAATNLGEHNLAPNQSSQTLPSSETGRSASNSSSSASSSICRGSSTRASHHAPDGTFTPPARQTEL